MDGWMNVEDTLIGIRCANVHIHAQRSYNVMHTLETGLICMNVRARCSNVRIGRLKW